MFSAIGIMLAAWLLADFISGLFHWFEDRYIAADTPLLGPLVGAPNDLHHREPQAFLRHGYWRRNWTTIAAGSGGLVVAWLVGAPPVVLLACVFVTQANEVHAWAHSRGKVGRLVDLLQQTGVIQSPRQHATHHRGDHRRGYCVMSDWLNPPLDACGFWRRLDTLAGLVGVRPKPNP